MTPHFAHVFDAFIPSASEGGKSEPRFAVSGGAGGKVRLGIARGGGALKGVAPPAK